MPESAGKAAAWGPAAGSAETWLEPVRWAALVVFVALPVFALLASGLTGRVVWTVVVALLPLAIVLLGYHRWRRICPLAWFAKLATRLGRPGERRASARWQRNYYYVAFGVFLASLWLRLVAINGNGAALALFLTLLALAALLWGVVYTGKTWCNYLCPVSVVEKIYTEPHGIRATPNSQCPKCTACKPACPDINEENGYWKEIGSRPKRFVYFAFPGVVLSFYLYFFLQSGTWSYYYSGRWTDEPGLLGTAFRPGVDAATAGFFFLPSVPRAVAALLTLVVGALAGLALFTVLEWVVGWFMRRRNDDVDDTSVRHRMFTVAAFVAFVIFYTFAGAPTIRLVPGAPHLFQIIVVATATIFLARRYTRRQQTFAEETLARQIIRRWEWADMKPPEDLREAFLIHRIRSQTQASGYTHLLEIYKEAVREAVASGFVNRVDIQRLESLRNQLQISQADHEKIMADLDEEERARITNPALQVSAEKRLQLDAYTRALQSYLERLSATAAAPDDSVIRHMRQEYGVTPEEHGAVLDDLLGKGQGMAPHVARAFQLIERALHTIRLLRDAPSAASSFLSAVLARRSQRAAEGLMRGFGCSPEEEKHRALRDGLLSEEAAQREAAVEALGTSVGPGIAARLAEARRTAEQEAAGHATLADAVRVHLGSADPYVRVAALYLLDQQVGVDEETLAARVQDDHRLVRETALCLMLRAAGVEDRFETGLVTVEKMISLRLVPLFSSLAPEDLVSLARACREKEFAPESPLCLEGETGDEVFIVLSGEVKVFRWDGAEQRVVAREKAGGILGEMAVLDPAPRAASVVAGAPGARVLCLDGETFREVLHANPAVGGGVIRALVARIRGAQPGPRSAEADESGKRASAR